MVKYWGYNTTKVRILQVAILKNFVNLSNGIKKSIIKIDMETIFIDHE